MDHNEIDDNEVLELTTQGGRCAASIVEFMPTSPKCCMAVCPKSNKGHSPTVRFNDGAEDGSLLGEALLLPSEDRRELGETDGSNIGESETMFDVLSFEGTELGFSLKDEEGDALGSCESPRLGSKMAWRKARCWVMHCHPKLVWDSEHLKVAETANRTQFLLWFHWMA